MDHRLRPLGGSLEIAESDHRVSRGHRVQVSLGGPLFSNSTKLDGKAPSCPFFFPSHQPSSIWGRGRTQGHLVLPQGSLQKSYSLGSAPVLPSDPVHPCSLAFPSPTPSLHSSPLTRGHVPSSPPNPCIPSSPHLLYHFHNLSSLQLQLVRLLRAVVEVHFAPSLGARRFGRATWDGTRTRPLQPGAPVP